MGRKRRTEYSWHGYRSEARPHFKAYIVGPDGRKRFYRTKEEARRECAARNDVLKREGLEALRHIPDWLRIEAMRCQETLEPHGVTLTDAVRFWVEHNGDRTKHAKMTIEEFRKAAVKRIKRTGGPAHVQGMKRLLSRMCERFGEERRLMSLSTGELIDWFESMPNSRQTKNIYRAVLSAAFGAAEVEPNLASKIPSWKGIRRKEPEVVTPDDFARLLLAARQQSAELVCYYAICGFAGLRPDREARLIDWKHINLDGEPEDWALQVRSASSKTSSWRTVQIQPVLRAWLLPHRKESGPVVDLLDWHLLQQKNKARRRAGYILRPKAGEKITTSMIEAEGLKPWPYDGPRKSFASYHLAMFGNLMQTASEMGHFQNRTTLEHYRRLVTKADARKWWSLYPPEYGEEQKEADDFARNANGASQAILAMTSAAG